MNAKHVKTSVLARSEAEREDSFEGRHEEAFCEWNLTDSNGYL